MNNYTIQLSHINKSFNKQKIIDNLDLTIHRGEIIAFVGNNGSGKSTILKMIAGLIYQDSGYVRQCGCLIISKMIYNYSFNSVFTLLNSIVTNYKY